MSSVLHRQAEAGGHRRAGRALRAPLRPARQEVVASERLDQLRAVKLGALVAAQWGKDGAGSRRASTLPGGAALLERGAVTRGWVLIDDGVPARLGGALAWSWQAGVDELHVLVQEPPPATGATGVIARRAAAFAVPPTVWTVDGRALGPATAAPPFTDPGSVPGLETTEALLAVHGADPVWEHGLLRGEVLGLEVARVINGRLAVGVGRHDREARAEMRPGEDLGDALAEAIESVRSRRRSEAPGHPANTLARSRWLRSVVCARPSLVDASELRPVAPPLPWSDLPESGAAPCTGRLQVASGVDGGVEGGAVVVVCSVGVDLDLVPTAADCRMSYGHLADLVLAVPEGDDVAVTRALAERLASPARVQTVSRRWEDLAAGL